MVSTPLSSTAMIDIAGRRGRYGKLAQRAITRAKAIVSG